jgi:hypothetical protein
MSLDETSNSTPRNRKAASPANDVVWGGEAIAEVIDRKPAATFHLLETGQLPARKVGKMWAASRSRLLSFLAGE